MTEAAEPRTSRRAVIASALGALGGMVAASLGRPGRAEAATGDALTAGGSFTADAATQITTVASAAYVGFSTSGAGVVGRSDNYVGVVGAMNASVIAPITSGVTGNAGDNALGVHGNATNSDGVRGTSVTGPGVTGGSAGAGDGGHSTGVLGTSGSQAEQATNTDAVGVYGYSNVDASSAGVWGDSILGTGVAGSGDYGVFGAGLTAGVTGQADPYATGVYGYSGSAISPPVPPAGVAVQATAGSSSQIALNVTGKAKFSRSGRTYVAAGSSSRVISMSGVTTSSYIIATPQTNRAGVYVQAVVPASGKFTIYLNKTVTGTTYVGYLVIN